MGAIFGIVSKKDCLSDVFFGTDYHSHLGTRRGGLAAYDKDLGLQRKIHNIQNAPFRTKFENIFEEMKGNTVVGCISDYDPQPLMIRSKLGTFAMCVVGNINNYEELIKNFLDTTGGHFSVATGNRINEVELVASLISQKDNFVDGIKFANDVIDGTASIVILKEGGNVIAARDKMGRLPIQLGKNEDGFCFSFESYAFEKMDYEKYRELGPGEIVEITPNEVITLSEPRKEMKMCAFLWSYYGYPTTSYEGINVETMRYRNGESMAKNDKEQFPDLKLDYVSGVPDSGTPHAIGYANQSKVPFARPYIKYTPTWARSFMPNSQVDRNRIAKMKQIPVHDLINGKDLLFVDDSIVRGTQLRETVDFLYEHGAKSVHIRSACPPIMYGCKYLNFSRATSDMELITRRTIVELEGEEGLNHLEEYADSNTERGKKMREAICKKMHFSTLEFQSLDGLVEAIGIDECNLCTYCWNGKEK
ncbi:MAG: amidophosphoribosyltransferase [Clostridia bacterium]|nr:amidophosphoribosyltransferase [Clostridia bacterium]